MSINPISSTTQQAPEAKKTGLISFLTKLFWKIFGAKEVEPLIMDPLPEEHKPEPKKVMPEFNYNPSKLLAKRNDPSRARARFVITRYNGSGFKNWVPEHIKNKLNNN